MRTRSNIATRYEATSANFTQSTVRTRGNLVAVCCVQCHERGATVLRGVAPMATCESRMEVQLM